MFGDWRHFGDLLSRNARLEPRGLGLACGDVRYTWAQSEARTNRLAHGLRRRGVARGDRVAVLAANDLCGVELLFACSRLGAVAVPLNTMLGAPEVATLLRDSEPVFLCTDPGHLETARDAVGQAPSVRGMAVFGDDAEGEMEPFEDLLTDEPETPPPLDRPIDADDLLIILYTSGTTGLPKGVSYSHGGALVGTMIHVLAIQSHHRHRVMLPSPLYSAAGFAGIACAVAVGSECHVLRFSVEAALATLDRERITFTNLVPTTLHRLLEHPGRGPFHLGSLEVLLYGGSPMPEPLLRRATAELGCDFRQTFATSETGLAGTVLEPEDHRDALADPALHHRLRSCGRPQVGVGVSILDEDWQEVPVGMPGDIAVRCAANMIGYWNRPDATAEVLRDGWIKTGDVARRDEDGYFYLLDRKNDRIVTGALNVFPSEVERVLAEHPAVADCVVVGLPDPTWGEAVTAFVVRDSRHPSSGGDPARELLDHCRGHLAGYQRPKKIVWLDSIPRNPAGKPLRRVLRQRHA